MQTRNGTKVSKLMKLDNCYVGLVNGTLMQWSLDGRRTGHNRSKLDLQLHDEHQSVVYANVYVQNGVKRVSGKRYSSKADAVASAPRGYIKTIEL